MTDDGADQELSGGDAFSVYDTYQIGYQPATRQASEIMQAVRRQFGDESGVQLEDADLIGWINDAQDTIVNRNRVLKTRASIYSIVGEPEYAYPEAEIEQVESLHYGDWVLPSLSFAQAEQNLAGQEDVGGTPQFWYEWGGSFRLWPTPDTPTKMTLFYTTQADKIQGPGDVLSVPDKYYQTILAYCLQQAYEMDEDWQASQAKAQQFDSNVTNFGEEERTQQRMTYQTITLVD